MAQDFSFDIVSKTDMQEVANAIQQAQKELAQRFDFKGSKSSIELTAEEIVLISDDEGKLRSVKDIVETKLVKRKAARPRSPGRSNRQARAARRSCRAGRAPAPT